MNFQRKSSQLWISLSGYERNISSLKVRYLDTTWYIVHFLMYTNLICWIYINYTWIIGISMILIQKLCCVQNANRSSPNCRFIPEWKIFEWHIWIKKKKKLWSFSRRKLYFWSLFNILNHRTKRNSIQMNETEHISPW